MFDGGGGGQYGCIDTTELVLHYSRCDFCVKRALSFCNAQRQGTQNENIILQCAYKRTEKHHYPLFSPRYAS